MDNFSKTLRHHLDWVKLTCDALQVQDTNVEILSDAMIEIVNQTNYAGGDSKPAQVNHIAKEALKQTGRL